MRSEKFWHWFEKEAQPKLAAAPRHFYRVNTFRKMMEHLDGFERPVHIVETGCIEDPTNWVGNGCSTLIFDAYAQFHHGSTVRSVDIDPVHVEVCRQAVSDRTIITLGDSVAAMKEFAADARPIDLVYLDATHLDWTHPLPAQHHHMNELLAILPALRSDTLVAVDDSPAVMDDYPHLEIGGKGGLVARYASEVGADLEFAEYQVGWTGMTNRFTRDDSDIMALIERARRHVDAGRLPAADMLYRRLMALSGQPWTPKMRIVHGEACAFFAKNALDNNKLGTAADWFREALSADPMATDYRIELVNRCYLPMGAMNVALTEAKRCTRISPDEPKAWACLGGIEHELNHNDESVAAYDKQILVSEGTPEAILDRVTIAIDTEDYDRAKKLCDSVIGTAREADAWHCRGMIAYRQGQFDDALTFYDRAIEMKARDLPLVHWNKSLTLHAIGRYREGWIEHEFRREQKTMQALSMPFKRFNLPVWNGEPPPATIHIHAEAGFGDNICLMRYLQLMVDQGYMVRYECQDGMAQLITDSMPEVEVVARAKDYPGGLGLKPFDYHLPIGSLPYIYKTDIDTVPWFGPYIKADPELVHRYRRMLPKGQRVGLCWSSGIREEMWLKRYGQLKSMHFTDLGPILDVDNCTFVSLQVGSEKAQCFGGMTRDDILPDNPTWAETAALIDNLDLVITVDTAIAHLAGAMGKPVWVMMHTQGSWHFMVERPGAVWNTRSPWYPSAKVFRQKQARQWQDVVTQIAAELERHPRQKV